MIAAADQPRVLALIKKLRGNFQDTIGYLVGQISFTSGWVYFNEK